MNRSRTCDSKTRQQPHSLLLFVNAWPDPRDGDETVRRLRDLCRAARIDARPIAQFRAPAAGAGIECQTQDFRCASNSPWCSTAVAGILSLTACVPNPRVTEYMGGRGLSTAWTPVVYLPCEFPERPPEALSISSSSPYVSAGLPLFITEN
jgi:hypothetical protein